MLFQSSFSDGIFSAEIGNVIAAFLELFEIKKNIRTNYMALSEGSTCLCDVLIMFLFFSDQWASGSLIYLITNGSLYSCFGP